MTLRAALVCLALCCMVLLTSCEGGSAPPPADHVVTAGGLGSAVAMHVGETLNLQLQENPSTGFSWHISWEPATALELVSDTYVPDEPIIPGSGGTRSFLLKAAEAGGVTVTVQYGRWWEGGERMDPQALPITITP